MSVSIQPRASASRSERQVDLLPISALFRFLWRNRQFDGLALAVGLTFVPISIAVTETFLAVALLLRLMNVARHRASLRVPRIFWIWLIWVGMQLLSWSASPEPRAGWGEIRHSLLIGALFLIVPALQGAGQHVAVWQGIFLASTLGSIFLVSDFVSRLIYYRREISAADDPSLYLRSGGLLNHWMIFATIEILVFAALLAYSRLYPEEKRFWAPVLAINAVAIVVSLTRMLWICCFLLLVAELVWRRSKWAWSLTLLPLALYFVVPAAIRARVRVSVQPGYYSNAERIQMLGVGWEMIRAHPLSGIGPGRVGKLYRSFLSPADPIPAFYGHLHNNLVQIAAEFGLPVAAAGVFLAAALFNDIRKAWRSAVGRENQFLCSTALLGLSVFLVAGGVEYTYGHSLGLIMLSFVVLSPLNPAVAGRVEEISSRRSSNQAPAPGQ
ncbi:MAG: O-antigen ligase family protein [Terriglobia bacterium]